MPFATSSARRAEKPVHGAARLEGAGDLEQFELQRSRPPRSGERRPWRWSSASPACAGCRARSARARPRCRRCRSCDGSAVRRRHDEAAIARAAHGRAAGGHRGCRRPGSAASPARRVGIPGAVDAPGGLAGSAPRLADWHGRARRCRPSSRRRRQSAPGSSRITAVALRRRGAWRAPAARRDGRARCGRPAGRCASASSETRAAAGHLGADGDEPGLAGRRRSRCAARRDC